MSIIQSMSETEYKMFKFYEKKKIQKKRFSTRHVQIIKSDDH